MGKLSTTAKAALVDLRAVAVDLGAAGAALHDSLGGYPATTPGAVTVGGWLCAHENMAGEDASPVVRSLVAAAAIRTVERGFG